MTSRDNEPLLSLAMADLTAHATLFSADLATPVASTATPHAQWFLWLTVMIPMIHGPLRRRIRLRALHLRNQCLPTQVGTSVHWAAGIRPAAGSSA